MKTVNIEHIKQTTLGDKKFLTELIDIYLDDAKPQLELLRAAVARADLTTAGTLAHRLEGASGNVGAESLSELCSQLARAGRQNRIQEIVEVMPRVEEEFARVQIYLARLRAGST